mgnify:CR=1 FL=1
MKQGYHVMVCHSSEKYEVERENVDALLAADVEGFVEGGQDALRAAADGVFVFSGKLCGSVNPVLLVGCHGIDNHLCYK